MKHTQTPWMVRVQGNELRVFSDDVVVALVGDKRDKDDKANAAHIVHCVNLHDELVAALEAIAAGMGNLSIERIEQVNGINDGKQRAIYLVRAIQISRAILAKVTK